MKRVFSAILSFLIIATATCAFLYKKGDGAFSAGMGDPQELADMLNALDPNASWEEWQAIGNAYLGTTGVKGDFDHDGIPDNQQSAKSSGTTSQANSSQGTQQSSETKSTNGAKTNNVEASEEPEE